MTSWVSLIAACDASRGIGLGGGIPWHHPEDFRRFRAATMGRPVIVGRATLESLPGPLRGRHVIALSTRPGRDPRADGWAGDLRGALGMAEALAGPGRVFVAGGAGLYAEAEGIATEAFLTRVPGCHGCDRFFPDLPAPAWRRAGLTRSGDLGFETWVRVPRAA